ncbi:LytTR family DNA-binding domain-containing protein [Lactiplantibacillus daowaiensis]|uniref:LytTR family DNA-binding domain-containing protein n=1 Tax=Lactiplantibacillus daowaiensis TaxID=2559918 RepID=A0ABW1RZ23_9LACO|nr:LytTR family DNA-binding domain-containing protein [Lactiplantibacillus daowaiensis]
MVQSHFEVDSAYTSADPRITIAAATQDEQINQLMAYLANYGQQAPTIMPVKADDQLVMVKPATIILADVVAGQLLIMTTQGALTSHERLSHFMQRVANPNFVQVSKHAVLNLDHLVALSDSFSGNLTAKLTNQVKTDVSRKYVKVLMQHLGI